MVGMAQFTSNWPTYVYAIGSDHAVEAALGYFINLLTSVLIAAVVPKEQLRPARTIAAGLAMIAVACWQGMRLAWHGFR